LQPRRSMMDSVDPCSCRRDQSFVGGLMTRTVFTTGASSGNGLETARLFQERAGNMAATMRNLEQAGDWIKQKVGPRSAARYHRWREHPGGDGRQPPPVISGEFGLVPAAPLFAGDRRLHGADEASGPQVTPGDGAPVGHGMKTAGREVRIWRRGLLVPPPLSGFRLRSIGR
jgi:hypothetical protein